jgi:hypothetical protein
MTTETLISKRLRDVAHAPMWADHAEIRKATLVQAASTIEHLCRLLNYYVSEDSDTRHDGFDVSAESSDFPTKAEAMKADAVELLRKLSCIPRAVA